LKDDFVQRIAEARRLNSKQHEPLPSPSAVAAASPTAVAAATPAATAVTTTMNPLRADPSSSQSPQPAPSAASPPVNNAQVVAFAAYLGADIVHKEPNLAPIVAEMLQEPLPSPWVAMRDPASGRQYFAHTETKSTSWDHPLKAQLVARLAAARSSVSAGGSPQNSEPDHNAGSPPMSKAESGTFNPAPNRQYTPETDHRAQ
jgi:hypothetical protein